MTRDPKQSISKLLHPIVEIIPQMPKTLEKRLEEFPEVFKAKFGDDLFHKVISLVAALENEITPDDSGYFPALAKIRAYDRKYQFEAYIKYMGLTLYWYEKQKMDAAWLYYSQAQYHLGCYDSWELVKDHLAHKDVERHHRAKGGKAKNQDATQPLMDALIAIIVEKKPPSGWKSKKQLFNAAEPVLDEIYKNPKYKNLPKHENLEENVLRWLRIHTEMASLYMEHSAPENFDGYPGN